MLVRFPLNNKKAPAVPKDTAWQDYRGEVNTPMVGVMVPKGVYIIDLDLYKGVTEEAVEAALGCSLDWGEAAIQNTLNGGRHYAFNCDDDLRQGSNLLGLEGFDTRAAGKGYIATGQGYEDLTVFDVEDALSNPNDLPQLPQAAIEALRVAAKQELMLLGDGEDDNALMGAVLAQGHGLSFDEVQEYLDMLPDSYASEQDHWFRVGMALWHETAGSDDGWRLFDEFSRRSPANYNESNNRNRWESFSNKNSANPITFASIIEAAGGAIARAKVVVKSVTEQLESVGDRAQLVDVMTKIANIKLDPIEFDIMARKIQAAHDGLGEDKATLGAIKQAIKKLRKDDRVGDFVDDYVFVTTTGVYLECENKVAMGPRAFDVKHNRETPSNDGEPQNATSYANNKITVVHDTMYHPQALEHGEPIFYTDGKTYFNTYTPTRVERVPVGTTDAVDIVKAHIAHLLPDEAEQQLIINYLAHNVQHPGKKIPWAILLQGTEGDGKSAFPTMMRMVLEERNVRILDPRELQSSFTGYAVGQCMSFMEEVKVSGASKYDNMNSVKPYISNDTVPVTRKGQDPSTEVNTTNYFMLTNYRDAIPVNDSDRRYAVFFSQWQNPDKIRSFTRDNPNYYPSLYEAIRNNAGELLDWLLTHVIPQSFYAMSRAPQTKAKEQMMMLSKSTGHEVLEDALEEFGDQVINGDELNLTLLQKLVSEGVDYFSRDSAYAEFPKTYHLKNILVEMGYQHNGRRRIGDGGRNMHTFYIKA